MKIWIIFGICVLTLVGCASAEYQKMQAERDQLLKNYEDLREEHNELKIKTDVTDTLLGKWKFLNLEIEESGVSEEIAETKAALYALDLKVSLLNSSRKKVCIITVAKTVTRMFWVNLLSSLSDTATNPSPLFGLSDVPVRRCPNFSSRQVPMESRLDCQVRLGLTQRERLVFRLRRIGYISQCTARCN